MESVAGVALNEIPKMVKVINQRTGRLYYKPIEQISSLSSQRLTSSSNSMQNPVVLASLVAGFLGVFIVFILIFTIWIRQRCRDNKRQQVEVPTELDSCSASSSSLEYIPTHPTNLNVSSDTFLTINEDTLNISQTVTDVKPEN